MSDKTPSFGDGQERDVLFPTPAQRLVARMDALKKQPSPTDGQVDRQMKASIEVRKKRV